MANINLKISSAGLDTDNFTITDNLGNTLASNVSRTDLLNGIDINGIDNSVTTITATSTGECTNSKSVVVDFSGGGGGETEECWNVRFALEDTEGCSYWTFSIQQGIGQATFQYMACGGEGATYIQLNNSETATVCVDNLQGTPTFSGDGFMTQGGACAGDTSVTVSYKDCSGATQSFVLDVNYPERTVCAQLSSINAPVGSYYQLINKC